MSNRCFRVGCRPHGGFQRARFYQAECSHRLCANILYPGDRYGSTAGDTLFVRYYADGTPAETTYGVHFNFHPACGISLYYYLDDVRSQSGWRNSPGFWRMIYNALEFVPASMTILNAAVCAAGRIAFSRGKKSHCALRSRRLRSRRLYPGYRFWLPGKRSSFACHTVLMTTISRTCDASPTVGSAHERFHYWHLIVSICWGSGVQAIGHFYRLNRHQVRPSAVRYWARK